MLRDHFQCRNGKWHIIKIQCCTYYLEKAISLPKIQKPPQKCGKRSKIWWKILKKKYKKSPKNVQKPSLLIYTPPLLTINIITVVIKVTSQAMSQWTLCAYHFYFECFCFTLHLFEPHIKPYWLWCFRHSSGAFDES